MKTALPFTASLLFTSSLLAQNTGGVFGPVVNDGWSALQYRATYDVDNDGFAQRIHYEQALNGDFMLRGVVGTRKTAESDVDFDFFQAELFWELSEDNSPYRTGVRFDLTLRDEDRPQTFGFHWMNQYSFSKDWSARFLTLTTIDFGENTRDGIGLQTRASLTRRLSNKISLGAELYNIYGSTDEILELDEQRHQLGPVLTYNLSDDFQIYSGVLFGLTDRDSEPQFRLWLTKSF